MGLKIGYMSDKDILKAKNISDDLRLARIFNNHKSEIKETHEELYTALCSWELTHLADLKREEERIRCNPDMNEYWNERRSPLPYQEMEDARVSLNDAAHYLIGLFEQTGRRYSTGETKIGKLLSIAAFKYAMYNKVLFSEGIYKYPNCGCLIQSLNSYICSEAYVNFEYYDAPMTIPAAEIEMIGPPVNGYANCLTDEIAREVIKAVFINFGAYSTKDLSDCINPIVASTDMVDEDGRVLLNRFPEKALSDFTGYENNKVLQYIFQ